MFDRVKQFFSKSLSNSVGVVTRNYARAPEFNPHRQVTGITYKAIDKIGQSLSVYKPEVVKKGGDVYVNHPLITLYNKPNPQMINPSDFIHLYGMLFEIYGETFWYLAKGERTNRVKEVYLLNPAQMELKIQEGELVGYVLHKLDGTQVPFTVEEIIHDKRPNPFNQWRGMSVLEKASTYTDIEISTARFTLNYINNNASPSGIVSLPEMEKETFKIFTQQWRENYEGPENAGKTAFIRGGDANFKAVGATLKDIDQKITRDMAKDDVLMMFDMPKSMLGLTDDKGFGRGNIEALEYQFAKHKLEPMMLRLDRIYNQIGESFGQIAEVTHQSPIPEDKEFELKTHEAGVNVWMTVNEVREQQNLPPLPDGDKLMPQNRVQTQPQKKLKIVAKPKVSKAEQVKKINQEQEEFRSNIVETSEIYTRKIKSEITKFADKQEGDIIGKINLSKKTYEEWLFSIKEESEALAALLLPLITELMETQSEEVAHFITGELLTISPEVRNAVEANIKQIAGIYNQDTIAALQRTLAEGQTAGESLVKLKKRVEQVYSDAKGYRAERIARTESLKASNNTAELVYKQNGYSRVEWFINPGACEFCRSYAGRTKSIGSNFSDIGDVITGIDGGQMRLEYSNVPYPPLHPNCTCSLIPVTE